MYNKNTAENLAHGFESAALGFAAVAARALQDARDVARADAAQAAVYRAAGARLQAARANLARAEAAAVAGRRAAALREQAAQRLENARRFALLARLAA